MCFENCGSESNEICVFMLCTSLFPLGTWLPSRHETAVSFVCCLVETALYPLFHRHLWSYQIGLFNPILWFLQRKISCFLSSSLALWEYGWQGRNHYLHGYSLDLSWWWTSFHLPQFAASVSLLSSLIGTIINVKFAEYPMRLRQLFWNNCSKRKNVLCKYWDRNGYF